MAVFSQAHDLIDFLFCFWHVKFRSVYIVSMLTDLPTNVAMIHSRALFVCIFSNIPTILSLVIVYIYIIIIIIIVFEQLCIRCLNMCYNSDSSHSLSKKPTAHFVGACVCVCVCVSVCACVCVCVCVGVSAVELWRTGLRL